MTYGSLWDSYSSSDRDVYGSRRIRDVSSHLSSHHWKAPPSWEGTRSQEVERKSMKLETREQEQNQWNEELVLWDHGTDGSKEEEKTRMDDARNRVGTSADPADSERTIRKHDGRSLHTHWGDAPRATRTAVTHPTGNRQPNGSTATRETEFINKKLLQEESPNPDGSAGES